MKVHMLHRFFCLLAGTVFLSGAIARSGAQENAKCPIMTDADADPEETVVFEGVKVGICCGKCGRLWMKQARYYIKAAPESVPQFKGMESKLGLDKITLLPQKFCPIKETFLICPDSPSTEYKGVKVWFFDAKSLAKWNADPNGQAERAIAAGLLPQLAGK